ncbi:MAG: hypothetical protein H0V75_00975, partial [Rubrobacter sp.]|nr:hypothetical protein [Rubrobacter sp.]
MGRRMAGRGLTVSFVCFIAAFVVACGGSPDSGEPSGETTEVPGVAEAYTIPGEEVFPEGVAYDEETGDFFVGSTTDGTIFRGNVDGGPAEMEVFLEPGGDDRETAVGLEVEGGRLYVAGGDTGRAWVYDAESGELVNSYETPEAEMTFINDVAVAPNGDA